MIELRKLSLAASGLVFMLTLAVSSVASAGQLNLAKTPESIEPVAVGEAVPSFEVLDPKGKAVTFDGSQLDNPAVIITYRGGWCPYCNVQLQELRNVLPELNELGVDVWFLTGDAPEVIFSSMKEKTQTEIEGLDYKIYSDYQLKAASELGIAFSLDEETLAKFAEYGVAKKSSVAEHSALLVPSVFVIDAEGIIRYSFFDPDYTVRLPAEELLQVVKDKVL